VHPAAPTIRPSLVALSYADSGELEQVDSRECSSGFPTSQGVYGSLLFSIRAGGHSLVNSRRQYVEADRMKVVAKLVNGLESNPAHSGCASLFEICVSIVDEQDL
jgi:hypothetical protein